jgi:DNA-binding XRE family transcriptional regulator
MPTRKFSELTKNWPAERKQKVARRVKAMIAEMHLDELREAREKTQVELAKTLGVNQGEISKIEHRADLYLSTLANYIEALGGSLEIRAVFPDGDVRITQFEDLPQKA